MTQGRGCWCCNYLGASFIEGHLVPSHMVQSHMVQSHKIWSLGDIPMHSRSVRPVSPKPPKTNLMPFRAWESREVAWIFPSPLFLLFPGSSWVISWVILSLFLTPVPLDLGINEAKRLVHEELNHLADPRTSSQALAGRHGETLQLHWFQVPKQSQIDVAAWWLVVWSLPF